MGSSEMTVGDVRAAYSQTQYLMSLILAISGYPDQVHSWSLLHEDQIEALRYSYDEIGRALFGGN